MQRVYKTLRAIDKVVEALLPPRMNEYIGCFELKFLLSTLEWESEFPLFKDDESVVIVGERGITFYIIKATIEHEVLYLKEYLDADYEYSDDHAVWKSNLQIKERIEELNKQL